MKKIHILSIAIMAICLQSFAQAPAYVATSGLLAWYPFNNSAVDAYSGYNNGVVYGGVSYGIDRFGTALSCYTGNGASGIDIPVNNFPSGNAARSVAAWFKQPLPVPSSLRQIFATGNNSTWGTRFGLTIDNGTNRVGWESVGIGRLTTVVPDSAWHHVVITYPSTGGGSAAIKVYYDGVLASATTVGGSISSFASATGPMHHIGSLFMPVSMGSWLYSWIGSLDDIGVWNREITPCEVSYLYYSGNPSLAFIGGPTQTLTVCQNSGPNSINSLLGVNELNVGITNTWSTLLAPLHGTLVSGYSTTTTGSPITPTGLTYTPATGYTGPDSFSVIVHDCNNTYDTTTVYVSVITVSPPVVSGPSAICVGTSAVYTSSVPGGSWSSSLPSVATINSTGSGGGASTGTTIISYSATNICGTLTDTEMVSVISTPSAGVVFGPSTICPGTLATYTTSGTGGGSWSSSNLAAVTINASTGAGGGGTSGTSIISYSVTNMCGTAVDTFLATIGSIVSVGVISGPTEVCAGSNITLFDGVVGGVWSSGAPSIGTIDPATGVAGGVSPGVVTYNYTVTNTCGVATVSYAVTVNSLPAASIISGPRNVCEGNTLSLTASPATGTWSTSLPGIATINSTGLVSGNAAGNAIISYTVTNMCGAVSDTHSIVVHPIPDAGIITGSTISLCIGQSMSLTSTASGGIWVSVDPSVASINAPGLVTTNSAGTTLIRYAVTNSYGCSDTASYLLTVVTPASLVITVDIEQADCAGEDSGKIVLNITGGSGSYNYTWSNGASTGTIIGLAAGTYSVSINDNITGCNVSRSYNVADADTLTISAKITNTSCNKANGSIEVIGVSGGVPPYNYLWSNGSTNAILNNLAQGLYALTATDSKNCIARYSGVVAVDSCGEIIIYDVITPNGDGKNDVWVIEGIFAYPDNTVEVFDKWGDRVFYAEGYKNNWGGSSGNGLLPDGTYFYLVKLNATTGNGPKPLTGSLLIKH